jgi:hypothetical protein
LIPKQDVGLATLAVRTCINLVSRVLVHTFEFLVSRSCSSPHNLLPRVPLGRFAGLKHRQLARQVKMIITTWRIRRTSSAKLIKINLCGNQHHQRRTSTLFQSRVLQVQIKDQQFASRSRLRRQVEVRVRLQIDFYLRQRAVRAKPRRRKRSLLTSHLVQVRYRAHSVF